LPLGVKEDFEDPWCMSETEIESPGHSKIYKGRVTNGRSYGVSRDSTKLRVGGVKKGVFDSRVLQVQTAAQPLIKHGLRSSLQGQGLSKPFERQILAAQLGRIAEVIFRYPGIFRWIEALPLN
jgi:hypothetical protein